MRLARFFSWSPADLGKMTWRRLLWWDDQAERAVTPPPKASQGG